MQVTANERPSLTGTTKKLLIMLHGVGSDGYDLMALTPYMPNNFDEYHFYSPHGPEAYIFGPTGYQWWDISSGDPKTMHQLLLTNLPSIKQTIQNKQTQLGLTNKDTILMGFSQGAILTSCLALEPQTSAFNAAICICGKLMYPFIENLEKVNTKTPFIICHGQEDKVILPAESDNMARYLQEQQIAYHKLIVPYVGHSFDGNMINFITEKLAKLTA